MPLGAIWDSPMRISSKGDSGSLLVLLILLEKYMPKAAHLALIKEAKKKGLKGKRKNTYIYGTLRKIEKNMKD